MTDKLEREMEEILQTEELKKKNLTVWASKEAPRYYWTKEYGVVELPKDWQFLPSGDNFLTRSVRKLGPYWIEMKKVKSYGHSIAIGTWAPKQSILKAQQLAEETKEARAEKRKKGRVYRERKEEKYKQTLKEAIVRYLNFAPEYKNLAEKIAAGASSTAAEKGSGRVGRTSLLSLEKKAELAANAYIRHRHTTYEEQLVQQTDEEYFPMDNYLYLGIKASARLEVEEFIEKHRG